MAAAVEMEVFTISTHIGVKTFSLEPILEQNCYYYFTTNILLPAQTEFPSNNEYQY